MMVLHPICGLTNRENQLKLNDKGVSLGPPQGACEIHDPLLSTHANSGVPHRKDSGNQASDHCKDGVWSPSNKDTRGNKSHIDTNYIIWY